LSSRFSKSLDNRLTTSLRERSGCGEARDYGKRTGAAFTVDLFNNLERAQAGWGGIKLPAAMEAHPLKQDYGAASSNKLQEPFRLRRARDFNKRAGAAFTARGFSNLGLSIAVRDGSKPRSFRENIFSRRKWRLVLICNLAFSVIRDMSHISFIAILYIVIRVFTILLNIYVLYKACLVFPILAADRNLRCGQCLSHKKRHQNKTGNPIPSLANFYCAIFLKH